MPKSEEEIDKGDQRFLSDRKEEKMKRRKFQKFKKLKTPRKQRRYLY
jgi:hypothetical protein